MCFLNVLKVMIAYHFIQLCCSQNCDYYQKIQLGQEYFIYNPEYPSNSFSPFCSWTGESPAGTILVLSCNDVNLPKSSDCQKDRILFSQSGDSTFQDAQAFCGTDTFTTYTTTNRFAMALDTSPGKSRFLCSLAAMKVDNKNCTCGRHFQKKIVGGTETGVNEFPSMAALLDVSTYNAYCGANIISDRYALTAAHCLLHQTPENLGLLVGDHNIETGNDTPYAALYKILTFNQHEDYVESTEINDIAVLKTVKTMTFNIAVGSICLPLRYGLYSFSGEVVTVLGWGFQNFGGDKSDVLMKVTLDIIPNNQCYLKMPAEPSQICTYTSGKDSCLSDSGGPLIWKDFYSGSLELVGIISYGIGCATTKPAINTRVTSYLSWIAAKTPGATYCMR